MSGKWWALDTTDLGDIQALGWWTVPGSPGFDANYRFSPHDFDLVGTTVVAANYHGGVWIWDVEPLVRHFSGAQDVEAVVRPSVRIPLCAMHGESMTAGHAVGRARARRGPAVVGHGLRPGRRALEGRGSRRGRGRS